MPTKSRRKPGKTRAPKKVRAERPPLCGDRGSGWGRWAAAIAIQSAATAATKRAFEILEAYVR